MSECTEHGYEARREKMQRLVDQGLNQTFIAKRMGLSRSRVCELLKEYNIVPARYLKGGIDLTTDKGLAQVLNCSVERIEYYRKVAESYRFKGINVKPPIAAYLESLEKYSADWGFKSIDEWWAVWEESGNYSIRGKLANGSPYAVMMRNNKVRPYTPENVFIKVFRQEEEEGPLPKGISHHITSDGGEYYFVQAFRMNKRIPVGRYATLAEAEEALRKMKLRLRGVR